MTREIDLSKMPNSKEVLPRYKERSVGRRNKRRLYFGNRTINNNGNDNDGDRERTKLPLPSYQLYRLSRLIFILERNNHHSKPDFIDLKREPGQSAAES